MYSNIFVWIVGAQIQETGGVHVLKYICLDSWSTDTGYRRSTCTQIYICLDSWSTDTEEVHVLKYICLDSWSTDTGNRGSTCTQIYVFR